SVLIAAEQPRGLSARNVWEGRIAAILREPDGSALVSLDTAVGHIASRITPQALADLHLEEGRPAWAVGKTHALGALVHATHAPFLTDSHPRHARTRRLHPAEGRRRAKPCTGNPGPCLRGRQPHRRVERTGQTVRGNRSSPAGVQLCRILRTRPPDRAGRRGRSFHFRR